MATVITKLESGIAWRSKFRGAKFGDADFHVDSAVRDSARRIVQHEFPKRDVPYAEDMGRRAREITVRGYIIAFMNDTTSGKPLLRKNYIPARDKLIAELETEWPTGRKLQLPFLGQLMCVCSRYRVTEEDKYGGYCTFDMTFQEYGQPPSTGTRDSKAGVYDNVEKLGGAIENSVEAGIKQASSGAVA